MTLEPLSLALVALPIGALGAALLAALRLVRGPTQADRVVALDILLASALALCVAVALATGSTVFLDVAIGLALVAFVATLGWSRLIERAADRDEGAGP
jgi:multicomponent Na+:H+ antiporter subunit F